MAKLTIKQQVINAKAELLAMTLRPQLRNWALSNGMDSRAAFPKFKDALYSELGINYESVPFTESVKDEPASTHVAPAEKTNLEKIAEHLGGKIWVKGDKTRIYVSGGNNYHYDGKWYYEISEDGTFESKCYLTSGYENKNREDYVSKYLSRMDEEINNAIAEIGPLPGGSTTEATPVEIPAEIEAMKNTPIEIKVNEYFGRTNTDIRYVADLSGTPLIDHYHGCGRGWAYVSGGKVFAFSYDKKIPVPELKAVPVEMSCTQLCFKSL